MALKHAKQMRPLLLNEQLPAMPPEYGTSCDLTDSSLFQWRRYLLSFPSDLRNSIIGDGVVLLLFIIFDDIYDSNYKGPLHDFVVIRHGGTVVRLHPHTSKDPRADSS